MSRPGFSGMCNQPFNGKKLSSVAISFTATAGNTGDFTGTGSGSGSATWPRDDTFPCWQTGPDYPSGYPQPSVAVNKFADCISACCPQSPDVFLSPNAQTVGSWTCTPASGPPVTGNWALYWLIDADTENPGKYLIQVGANVLGAGGPSCWVTSDLVWSVDNIAPEDLIGSHEISVSNDDGGSSTCTVVIS
ncbi:MAG: hypothetical protein LV481_12735 [Methylacidiphilales bacterium]|nr:hypothetical protein [Candidatus Methylacidiphilales bacterium]